MGNTAWFRPRRGYWRYSALVAAILGALVLLAFELLKPSRPAPPDPAESLPGGGTTRAMGLQNTFLEPAGNLSLERQLEFYSGGSLFRQAWLIAPSSTTLRDGLGPLFNARACSTCHIRGGRGRPPLTPQEPMVSLTLRLSVPGIDPHLGVMPEPTYGDQLQILGIALTKQGGLSPGNGTTVDHGPVAEGFGEVAYETRHGQYADGEPWELRVPRYTIRDLAYGPLHPDTLLSPRVAPALPGAGLLEAIPYEDIAAAADPDDADDDGISGRTNRVWDRAKQRAVPGRFGWKASQPNLLQQAAAAFRNDIGITNALYPSESCTPAQVPCRHARNGNGPATPHEISDSLLASTTYFLRFLAVPKRRNAEAPDVLEGRYLFRRIGCAACHVPRHVTGEVAGFPELSNQIIWPYTDLLLHDMGDSLADGRSEFDASGREWRTPPLWGLGWSKRVAGHETYLHDGRARSLNEAILWHGGEARSAQRAFLNLLRGERQALVAFLKSL